MGEVLKILTNPIFLSGFGWILLGALLTTFVAGGLGVALGHTVHKSASLSRSMVVLLRIGRWLPFFLFWGLSVWRIPDQRDPLVLGLNKLATGAIAIGPVIFLAACYDYLRTDAKKHRDYINVWRSLFSEPFLLALLLTILWQINFTRVWPWGWTIQSGSANFAVVLAIGAVVYLVNLLRPRSLSDPIGTNDMGSAELSSSRRSYSLWLFLALTLAAVSLWQVFAVTIENALGIVGPVAVGEAIYRVLISGSSSPFEKPIWFDIGITLAGIFAGVGIAMLLALPFVAACMKFLSPRLAISITALTYVAPIALTNMFIGLFGIGMISKIVTVVSFSFFPVARALWNYHGLRLIPRLLLALEAGMPLAFIGMMFSEAMAATAGIGFLLLVFPANNLFAEATATGIISFALLAASSALLRNMARLIRRPSN